MATERSHWRATRHRNEARCARILAASAPLQTDDLLWEDVGKVELDERVITTLVYMRDVEGFTERYLVGLAAHRTTLADPLIARFLRVWQAEEAGHARALDAYLRRYADARGLTVPARQPPPPAAAAVHERVLARVGGPVGRVVAAGHMAWGAANELLTLNGYRLLAARCGDPVLATLLDRIAAQESRHYSFYLLQAEWRLQQSGTARHVLRRVLRGAWTPVGVGDGFKTAREFGDVAAYLASGDDGQRAVDRMDRRFAALPGFDDLRIYRRATAAAGSPPPRQPGAERARHSAAAAATTSSAIIA